MNASLQFHSAFGCAGLDGIEVAVERLTRADIELRFTAIGNLTQIMVPPPAPPERADGLWQSTCLELFLRRKGEAGYSEFNFAPSSRWAAYSFSGYRDGMMEAPLPAEPEIQCVVQDCRLEVTVSLHLPLDDAAYAMNLAAVIESRAGGRAFWAAKHPAGEPDFHAPDCFIHQLPAAPRA
jgi:hypothetical protein